jgi:hypothetical protein
VVWTGAQERDAGRIFRKALKRFTTKCDSSRLRRHVGTVSAKRVTMGAGSSTTSFTFCSMRGRPWMRCGEPSSSAEEEQREIWCGASAGCC